MCSIKLFYSLSPQKKEIYIYVIKTKIYNSQLLLRKNRKFCDLCKRGDEAANEKIANTGHIYMKITS